MLNITNIPIQEINFKKIYDGMKLAVFFENLPSTNTIMQSVINERTYQIAYETENKSSN